MSPAEKTACDLVDALTEQVADQLRMAGTEGQLALLCGVCEGLIASAIDTDTMRAGGLLELKELLKSLPWYKEWRGDGELK